MLRSVSSSGYRVTYRTFENNGTLESLGWMMGIQTLYLAWTWIRISLTPSIISVFGILLLWSDDECIKSYKDSPLYCICRSAIRQMWFNCHSSAFNIAHFSLLFSIAVCCVADGGWWDQGPRDEAHPRQTEGLIFEEIEWRQVFSLKLYKISEKRGILKGNIKFIFTEWCICLWPVFGDTQWYIMQNKWER